MVNFLCPLYDTSPSYNFVMGVGREQLFSFVIETNQFSLSLAKYGSLYSIIDILSSLVVANFFSFLSHGKAITHTTSDLFNNHTKNN